MNNRGKAKCCSSQDLCDACYSFTPQWEPVQYFNNKIICDLVEEKFKGIISILVSSLRGGRASSPPPFMPSLSSGRQLRDRAELYVEGR